MIPGDRVRLTPGVLALRSSDAAIQTRRQVEGVEWVDLGWEPGRWLAAVKVDGQWWPSAMWEKAE